MKNGKDVVMMFGVAVMIIACILQLQVQAGVLTGGSRFGSGVLGRERQNRSDTLIQSNTPKGEDVFIPLAPRSRDRLVTNDYCAILHT